MEGTVVSALQILIHLFLIPILQYPIIIFIFEK